MHVGDRSRDSGPTEFAEAACVGFQGGLCGSGFGALRPRVDGFH